MPTEECSDDVCENLFSLAHTEQRETKSGDVKAVQLTSAIAIDIDSELRSRLKAIRMEGAGVEDPTLGGMDRKTQLLTSRLDALQRELDLKNKTLANYDSIRAEMDRKKEENKELKGRVLGLEQTTIILQQELSVMRSLQKEEKKITPLKSGGSIKQKSPLETKKILVPTGLKSVEKKRDKVSPKQGGLLSVKALQMKSTPSSDAEQSNKLLSVFEKESVLESGPSTPLNLDGHKDVLSVSVSVQEDKENVANRLGVCE